MTEDERTRLQLDRLIKHQENTRDNKFYAIQRIDLLNISISGAGIYGIFEMLKFLENNNVLYEPGLIRFAGILFVATIILNFTSQWTGYKANLHEIDSTELEISKEKGDSIDEHRLGVIDGFVKCYNILTTVLNTSSTLTMIVGLVLVTIFCLITFTA